MFAAGCSTEGCSESDGNLCIVEQEQVVINSFNSGTLRKSVALRSKGLKLRKIGEEREVYQAASKLTVYARFLPDDPGYGLDLFIVYPNVFVEGVKADESCRDAMLPLPYAIVY